MTDKLLRVCVFTELQLTSYLFKNGNFCTIENWNWTVSWTHHFSDKLTCLLKLSVDGSFCSQIIYYARKKCIGVYNYFVYFDMAAVCHTKCLITNVNQ